MHKSFVTLHQKEIIAFGVGLILAGVFLVVPALHGLLRSVDRLGYPGMFLAGVMYGSGLTAPIAMIIFVDTPPDLHLLAVAVIGGFGSALYDLAIFTITRRETRHGWLATRIGRIRERHPIPNWLTTILGVVILISPLPDELAAGLFGLGQGRAGWFFLYSFASNTLGIMLLSSLG